MTGVVAPSGCEGDEHHHCVLPIVWRNKSGHGFCIFHGIASEYAMAFGLMVTRAKTTLDRTAEAGSDSEPNWLDPAIAECLATADRLRADLEDGDYTRLGNYLSDEGDDG